MVYDELNDVQYATNLKAKGEAHTKINQLSTTKWICTIYGNF